MPNLSANYANVELDIEVSTRDCPYFGEEVLSFNITTETRRKLKIVEKSNFNRSGFRYGRL